MPAGQPHVLVPPLMGVRGDVPPYEIPDGYLWRGQNMLARFGRLVTRPGLSVATTTGPGGRLSGGVSFKTAASNDRVIAASTTKWKSLGAGSWTDISGAVTFTTGPEDPTRFAVFQQAGVNWAIGVNNHDALYAWDGAAAAIVPIGGTPPSTARDLTTVGNFVVVHNTVEGGNRFSVRTRWSAFNDKDTWPANNFADHVALGAGDNGVGIRALSRTSMAIYLDQSVWVGTAQGGVTAFAFELVARVPGPCSPAAIVAYGSSHFYLGRDGRLYRFDALGAPQPISDPIDAYLQTSGLSTQFRSVNRARVWGEFNPFDRNIWWFYPGPNNPDPTLGISYSVDTGALFLHSFPVALTAGWAGDEVASLTWNDLASFTWTNLGATYPTWDSFGGTLESTMFVGSSAGQVYRQRYGLSDDGAGIVMIWEFPLKAWLGLDQMQHVDGLEAWFEQVVSGPAITVNIGVSAALAEAIDPAYTLIGTHDTSLTTRQKLTQNTPTLNARFASLRFNGTTTVPVAFKGGVLYEWPEQVP